MSKAALPWRPSLVASAKPLVKRSCGILFFLVFDYWLKLERVKREPTKHWLTSNTNYVIPNYLYIHFL